MVGDATEPLAAVAPDTVRGHRWQSSSEETRSHLSRAYGCCKHPPPLAKKLALLNSSWVR